MGRRVEESGGITYRHPDEGVAGDAAPRCIWICLHRSGFIPAGTWFPDDGGGGGGIDIGGAMLIGGAIAIGGGAIGIGGGWCGFGVLPNVYAGVLG